MPSRKTHAWLLERLEKVGKFLASNELVRWRTGASFFYHDFKNAVAADKDRKFYSPEFFESMHRNKSRYEAKAVRITIINLIITISLFLSIVQPDLEITALRFRISDIAKVKEILLFVAVNLSLLSFIHVLHSIAYGKLTNASIEGLPYRARFMTMAYGDPMDTANTLLSTYMERSPSIRSAVTFAVALLGGVFFFTIYLVATFYVHIAVVINVILAPNLSRPWPFLLTVYVIFADLFSIWLLYALHVPRRIFNKKLYLELKTLEKENPTLFKQRVREAMTARPF